MWSTGHLGCAGTQQQHEAFWRWGPTAPSPSQASPAGATPTQPISSQRLSKHLAPVHTHSLACQAFRVLCCYTLKHVRTQPASVPNMLFCVSSSMCSLCLNQYYRASKSSTACPLQLSEHIVHTFDQVKSSIGSLLRFTA